MMYKTGFLEFLKLRYNITEKNFWLKQNISVIPTKISLFKQIFCRNNQSLVEKTKKRSNNLFKWQNIRKPAFQIYIQYHLL